MIQWSDRTGTQDLIPGVHLGSNGAGVLGAWAAAGLTGDVLPRRRARRRCPIRRSGGQTERGFGLGASTHDGEPFWALEGAGQGPGVACRGEGRP